MSCGLGVSYFHFCWTGESWLLNFIWILAHWLRAMSPSLHMTSSENLEKWQSSGRRQPLGSQGPLCPPPSLPPSYTGPTSGRQRFIFQFISLCVACGAEVWEALSALCQVPGTCRPVMEYPRLYISLGDEAPLLPEIPCLSGHNTLYSIGAVECSDRSWGWW